jgi:hypothetical protein
LLVEGHGNRRVVVVSEEEEEEEEWDGASELKG